MIEVTNIRVRSFDLGYLDVYWAVAPCFEDVLDYEFIVLTSDAEFGPYHPLTPPLVDRYHIRDNTVRGRHSFYHRRYYRLIARKRSDPTVSREFPEVGGACLEAPPDLIALEMARLNNLRLEEFSGRKLWVFPRRQSGQRCTVCHDHVSNRRIKSSCLVCFDTTWVGGFYAPVSAYGLIVSPSDLTVSTSFAQVQNQNTTLSFGNYPELNMGDVLVEAENVRWRVGERIDKTEKGRSLIRQQASIHRIPSPDIEYKLPIQLTRDEEANLIASPERNYTNPHNLEDDSLLDALNGLFGKR